jgi:hypothetical protein
MSQLKDQQTGASADNFTVGGNLVVTGTSVHTGATTFTGAVVMSTALPVASGGTGASTAGNARTNLSAASSGANSDITSITGLTTALTVAQGGTGAATHTSKGVLIGNGTSAVTTVSPGTSGNVLTSDGTSWTSTVGAYSLTSGTAVASTSGTSIDFTSIPSWVKRITVMLNAVSTNNGGSLILQIGSGSIATSGYSSNCANLASSPTFDSSTSSFLISNNNPASDNTSGTVVISNLSGNIWISVGNLIRPGTAALVSTGNATLGGTLDRVRITTVNGTDTFDAGSINILYE